MFNYEEKDLGVFLDIFPFDGLPDNPVKQKEIGEEMDKLKLNFMNSIGKLYASGNPSNGKISRKTPKSFSS